jgi:hypothetical protein
LKNSYLDKKSVSEFKFFRTSNYQSPPYNGSKIWPWPSDVGSHPTCTYCRNTRQPSLHCVSIKAHTNSCVGITDPQQIEGRIRWLGEVSILWCTRCASLVKIRYTWLPGVIASMKRTVLTKSMKQIIPHIGQW